MKKLFTFVMLMIVMSITVTAQLATYSVGKIQITEDESWKDHESVSTTDLNIMLIYDFAKKKIKITNKDQSMFFIRAADNLDDWTDDDGDILKQVALSVYDEEGNDVQLLFQWWEDEQVTFSGGFNTIVTVYNEDYWIRYFMVLEMYREED